MSNEAIVNKLNQLLLLKTHGFCYSCYIKATVTDEGEVCPKCGSDDLMRELDGFGCEYGTKPFYEPVLEIIEASGCEADLGEEWYEGILNELYGEVSLGRYNWDTGEIIHKLDPVSFEMDMENQISSMEEDGEVIELEGVYYWSNQLEQLLDNAIYDAEIMNS